MQGFEYRFPAVRGIQAGREFYVAMCPLGLVRRIFVPDESSEEAPHRSQRVLNKGRVPKLAEYLASNPDDYTFSAITACVDGSVEFTPLSDDDDWELGRLVIPMSADLLITDGQHRWRAISKAVELEPELESESLPVVLYVDEGLERRQQMFADLNMHAVRPTRSLGILYDHRDPLAELTRYLAEHVPLFAERTEVEKTSISNRSGNLFTLSAIYQATAALLGRKEGDEISRDDRKTAERFWTVLGEVVTEWSAIIDGEMKPWELRGEYIHAHGVVLQAFGKAGHALMEEDLQWAERLRDGDLDSVDWRRSNTTLWEGRAMSNGRVSKARKNVALTTSLIKQRLGLALSEKEKKLEEELREMQETMQGEAA